MNDFWEKLKDILYDGIDYIIMIAIIAVVALIINWRLGGLFTKNVIGTLPKNTIKETNNENVDKPAQSNKENENIKDVTDENDEEKKNDENSGSVVKISIHPGALPSKIGNILETNGLVESKNEFVQKAIDMKLETKLKYGEFEIIKGSSMEEILKILTK